MWRKKKRIQPPPAASQHLSNSKNKFYLKLSWSEVPAPAAPGCATVAPLSQRLFSSMLTCYHTFWSLRKSWWQCREKQDSNLSVLYRMMLHEGITKSLRISSTRFFGVFFFVFFQLQGELVCWSDLNLCHFNSSWDVSVVLLLVILVTP